MALLERENAPANDTTRWTIRLVIAALAVIVLFFAFSSLFQNNPSSPEDLFVVYFKNADIQIKGEAEDEQWEGALELIKSRKYAESIPILQKLQADSTFAFPDEVALYLSQCQLKTGDTQATLDQLSNIPPDHPQYGLDRLWIMAMANLLLNEPERVQLILNQLQESEAYGAQAREISAKLEEQAKVE